MTLAELQTMAYVYLATSSDDPNFPATTMTLLANQAYDQVVADMLDANPGYLSTTVTLTPDSSTALTYTFSTQAPAITDYHKWLEIRYTSQTGAKLCEVRPEELDQSGPGTFALTGPDDTPVLTLGFQSTPGMNLFLRYAYWPATLVLSTDVPVGVPTRYHDLLALRMAELAFAMGGEATFPPNLSVLAQDRYASLLATVGRRGVQASRTRGFGNYGFGTTGFGPYV